MTDAAHDLADDLREVLDDITPVDESAREQARQRQGGLAKPAGSLGQLEAIAEQLAAIAGVCPPPVPARPAVAVFAGDHGVHAQGITPWPQAVSGRMVALMARGDAVINSLSRSVGASLTLVDVGLATTLPGEVLTSPLLVSARVAPGTGDMTLGSAMTREEALQAVMVGVNVARGLVNAGADLLVTGDVGVTNATSSAALIAAMTGTDPALCVGRATGLDDEVLTRRKDVVRAAVTLHCPDATDALGTLAALGGLEHAGLVGLLLGAAEARVPVLLDGVIANAAALVATFLAPEATGYWLAGHRSHEPAARYALEALEMEPLLSLDMYLGEGTGAVLAVPIVQAAARLLHDVATFAEAGIGEPVRAPDDLTSLEPPTTQGAGAPAASLLEGAGPAV